MEDRTRAYAFRVGIFMTFGLILLIVIFFTVVLRQLFQWPGTNYEIEFTESVVGLEPGAPVRFNGVEIGDVVKIEPVPPLDPSGDDEDLPGDDETNPRPVHTRARARVTIRVWSDHVPIITTGCKHLEFGAIMARLETDSLLAGRLAVALEFVRAEQLGRLEWETVRIRTRVPEEGDGVLVSRPSVVSSLLQALSQERIDSIFETIENIGNTFESLRQQISEPLQDDPSQPVTQTLWRLNESLEEIRGSAAAFEQLTEQLNGDADPADHGTVARINGLLHGAGECPALGPGEECDGLHRAIGNLAALNHPNCSDQNCSCISATLAGLRATIREDQVQIRDALIRIRATMDQLARTLQSVQELAENPSTAIWGSPQASPIPGEQPAPATSVPEVAP